MKGGKRTAELQHLLLFVLILIRTLQINSFSQPNANSQKTIINQKSKKESHIPFLSSKIQVEQISISYPVTFLQTLFSSVPKREYALQNFTATFGPEESETNSNTENQNRHRIQSSAKNSGKFTLLIGASSSGKTTLLRLLAGLENPSSGYIIWNSHYDISTCSNKGLTEKHVEAATHFCTKPIIIDSKPSMTTMNDSKNVKSWIEQSSGLLSSKINHPKSKTKVESFLNELSEDFANILKLSESQLLGTPSQLTPSGQYIFGLACACMESVCSFVSINNISEDNTLFPTQNMENTFILDAINNAYKEGIHYPILLLDELMDFEHSSIALQVSQSLQELANMGGITVCVTHKPKYFLKHDLSDVGGMLKQNGFDDSLLKKRVITLSAEYSHQNRNVTKTLELKLKML